MRKKRTYEDVSYLYVQVIYYDNEGNVLGITGTSVTDFLAGRTVSFETSGIALPDLIVDDIADYKVIAQDVYIGL